MIRIVAMLITRHSNELHCQLSISQQYNKNNDVKQDKLAWSQFGVEIGIDTIKTMHYCSRDRLGMSTGTLYTCTHSAMTIVDQSYRHVPRRTRHWTEFLLSFACLSSSSDRCSWSSRFPSSRQLSAPATDQLDRKSSSRALQTGLVTSKQYCFCHTVFIVTILFGINRKL